MIFLALKGSPACLCLRSPANVCLLVPDLIVTPFSDQAPDPAGRNECQCHQGRSHDRIEHRCPGSLPEPKVCCCKCGCKCDCYHGLLFLSPCPVFFSLPFCVVAFRADGHAEHAGAVIQLTGGICVPVINLLSTTCAVDFEAHVGGYAAYLPVIRVRMRFVAMPVWIPFLHLHVSHLSHLFCLRLQVPDLF